MACSRYCLLSHSFKYLTVLLMAHLNGVLMQTYKSIHISPEGATFFCCTNVMTACSQLWRLIHSPKASRQCFINHGEVEMRDITRHS